MPFIADASATLPWCFEDESTSWSEALFDRVSDGEILFVPSHWSIEVTNGLRTAERRGRMRLGLAEAFLHQLGSLSLHVDPAPRPDAAERLLLLSRKHRLTIYDAVYLELAMRLELELATLDGELISAALSENVKLL